jgi:hypothetical protein
MRSVRAKVVKGTIVTGAKLPESTIELDDADEAAIRTARASIRTGRTVEMDKLMAALGRF